MNLGALYDVEKKELIAILCSDYEHKDFGYSTYDENLAKILDVALKDSISMPILNNNEVAYKDIQMSDAYYMAALNYILPFPLRINEIRSVNGKLDETLEDAYILLDSVQENIKEDRAYEQINQES